MSKSIKINDIYFLSPLLEVENDDIITYLKKEDGIYICSFPDQLWHNEHGLKVTRNYSIRKKQKMFDCLSDESILLSPTEVNEGLVTKKNLANNRVVHLSSRYKRPRLKQIEYSFQLLKYVISHRKSFVFIFYYNFEMPIFFTAFFLKYFLKKKIYVDFEDDYTLISRNWLKNLINKWLFSVPDMVICINRKMVQHFHKKIKCLIFNGFIDLEYMKTIDFKFRENSTFLFAGSLDEIRGADLLPDIINALKKEINSFKINVCGAGPLEKYLTELNIPEIKFYGFLNEEDYFKLLNSSDFFLVLQKPDHPFNQGSFPSKVEYYSSFKKPIFSLKLK